mmetsp:Transcript_27046/g.46927  ORF Transcript_27046/g.46927 Transcript_27046/m.46927 type:complete len:240 (-) Transcript_27046:99-818(-)
MIAAEYSTRTLTPTHSNGSLQQSSSGAALRPILVREHVPIQQTFPGGQQTAVAVSHPNHYLTAIPSTMIQSPSAKSLGQSASVSSLLTVASDTSGPPAMAPPSSAALNTGEVLHPYSNSQAPSDGMHFHGGGQSLASSARSPATSSQGQMTVVAQSSNQPTWVIEEVIDFGVPLDEIGIREYDDQNHPLGCKLLMSPRGRGGLFDGCVRSLCYDEEQVLMMQHQQGHGQDGGAKQNELC